MRTLFLIRHAKSSWDNPALRDFERPLNERGLNTAPRMASYLTQAGVQPDLLVSSPAKRAISTALFFGAAFGVNETQIVRNEDIYEASVTTVLRIISQLPDQAHTVLLFGHNPTFTDLANGFSTTPIINVPTCGIVRIETQADNWRSMYEGNTRVIATYFPKEVL
jgi:phosphohistidine phosphatase